MSTPSLYPKNLNIVRRMKVSKAIRVVVEGGGCNLYYIRNRNDEFQIYHHRVGVIWDEENLIGTADDIEDARDLIEKHSGEDIDSFDLVGD